MIQIVCFRPVFAVYQIINIYISKSRKIFNLISLKMLTPEYPKWKNLTVAQATFATVWIRACRHSSLKQTVKKPTRQSAILDLILTNMHK